MVDSAVLPARDSRRGGDGVGLALALANSIDEGVGVSKPVEGRLVVGVMQL